MPSAVSVCDICSVGVAVAVDERRELRVCLSCQHSDFDQTFSLERLQALWALSHEEVAWRHDVDFDLLCAALMAEYEQAAGIQSTYYIRLRGPYNVFDPEVGDRIQSIIDTGHRIGLHHDAGLARSVMVDDAHLLQIERDILKDWHTLGREFRDVAFQTRLPAIPVAFHAPPDDLRWRTWATYDVADSSEWEGSYIADSRGVWRDSPEERLKAGTPLQINLHPEWWFLDEPERTRLRNQEALKP